MRALVESRFGHDFSRVRVHTDERAAASVRLIGARAYAAGEDIVFASGEYGPRTSRGRRLLAHELAHVVQQRRRGDGLEAEPRARRAAEGVAAGRAIEPRALGGAAPGVYAEEAEEGERRRRSEYPTPALRLSWPELARTPLLGTPPPARGGVSPEPRSFGPSSLGDFSLTSPGGIPGVSPRLRLSPQEALALVPPPWLTPQEPSAQEAQGAPKLPSRLSVIRSGRFSLGLRLGFPEADLAELPGAPAPLWKESLERAQLLDWTLPGSVPSSWERLDKGKLAESVWGIFSTSIAPDVARSITSGLSSPAGPPGISFELDLVLLGDFSGGGISFTVRHP